MQNSICLSERNETSLANNDVMTTKELAQSLGVDVKTIQRTAAKLFNPSTLMSRVINGGKSQVFNEAQATAIKLELQNHSKVNALSPKTTLEKQLLIKQAMRLQDEMIAELQAQNEMQKAMIEEMQPKSDVYDSISDSATLQDLQTAAVTIGIKNIFKILEADGIIEKKTTNDGQAYYKPIAKYAEYLALKDGKAWTDPYGVKHVRPRIFVTGKGLLWLTKKYGAEK